MGLLKLGFLANFLSHPVIAGFITASGILIAVSQFKHILGIEAHGHTLPEILLFPEPAHDRGEPDHAEPSASAATGFLFWVRKGLKPFLIARGVKPKPADIAQKAGPVGAVVVTRSPSGLLGLADRGVAIVGEVPQALPPLTMPGLSPDLISAALHPRAPDLDHRFRGVDLGRADAGGQETPAHRPRPGADRPRRGQYRRGLHRRLPGDGRLRALGGEFRRGRRDAGGRRLHRRGLAIAALALTPLIYFLPKATLAATIIVAVLSLVDFSILTKTWTYAKADFVAVAATILLTLGLGVEAGVSAGVILSIGLHLYKTSKPHVAEVGLVPGTQHFRNILRHEVETDPEVVTLRIDESLYFANARFLEDLVQDRVCENGPGQARGPDVLGGERDRHVGARKPRGGERTAAQHGRETAPVGGEGPGDRPAQTLAFPRRSDGEVFLSQYDAWMALTGARPDPDLQAAQ
jgi:SulP family sulfate permease